MASIVNLARSKDSRTYSEFSDLTTLKQCMMTGADTETIPFNEVNVIMRRVFARPIDQYYLFAAALRSDQTNKNYHPRIRCIKRGSTCKIIPVEKDQCRHSVLSASCGVVFNTIIGIKSYGPPFHNLLVTAVFNEIHFHYELVSLLLNVQLTPVQQKSSALRKLLCKSINYFNGDIRLGNFSVHPETGAIRFRISSPLQQKKFDELISNRKIRKVVETDMNFAKQAWEALLPKLMKITSNAPQFRKQPAKVPEDIPGPKSDSNGYSKIIPCKDPTDSAWKVYHKTPDSQLRCQKVTFIDQNKPLKPITKIISLKCPSTVDIRKRKEKTFDSPIERQAQIVKIFQSIECAYLSSFYNLDGPAMDFGKVRRVEYQECVASGYYTYFDVKYFAALNCKTMSLLTKTMILVHVTKGLLFLKQLNMTHCKLNWSNVMLAKRLLPKISNFADAHVFIDPDNKQLTAIPNMADYCPRYTLPYSPPQRFLKINFKEHGHKYDVYSFGVMLMELLFECFPMQTRFYSQNKLIEALKNGTYRDFILVNQERIHQYVAWETVNKLLSLVLRCLQPKPESRPDMQEIEKQLQKLYQHIAIACK